MKNCSHLKSGSAIDTKVESKSFYVNEVSSHSMVKVIESEVVG